MYFDMFTVFEIHGLCIYVSLFCKWNAKIMLVQRTLHYWYSMAHIKYTKGKGKQVNLFTMSSFRRNLSSSNEYVYSKEFIKDHGHSQ